MKIEFVDDNIIVFLNKYITKDLDYKDKKVLETELRNIFDKLKNYYNIKIKGYYDVYIYIDFNYGAILELKEDDLGYLEYDDTLIDMRIMVNNIEMLYKVDDILLLDIPYNLYLYKGNFYIEPLDRVNNISMGKLLENSEIIYKGVEDIKRYGKVLKNVKYVL
ncbi:MAG: hypothetical protein IJ565_05515 [Bacilli bacterium]|nr:hypothetical protein [Bacilli bacterium]